MVVACGVPPEFRTRADGLSGLKASYAAQNVIPLVYKPDLTPTITTTLNAVSAKLTTAALLELNNKVSGSAKEGYTQAAQEWLTSVGLG
jgi:osmoprotectant transport system substrate-binding protein